MCRFGQTCYLPIYGIHIRAERSKLRKEDSLRVSICPDPNKRDAPYLRMGEEEVLMQLSDEIDTDQGVRASRYHPSVESMV